MTTMVINIREAPPGFRDNPDYVFIGRPGPWGNPFKGDRAVVIPLFEEYARSQPKGWVEPLRGKILVCFCKPLPCHGDVYEKLLKETEHGS